MHMADALISPVVGGAFWLSSAGLIAYSSKKVKESVSNMGDKVPLMGVLGAFIFASQMINFSIPGTGSSGHLGGGMILSILLGPYAGFLTMASVLLVQALFFADGGLLALGCNIFNLAFYTCFIAYPLIFKKIYKNEASSGRIITGSLIAAIIGLQLGAFSVVLQTLISGKSALSFGTFLLMMQPIHLAIGIIEGLVTAFTVMFVWKAQPEILQSSVEEKVITNFSFKKVIYGLIISTVLIGGIFSWFASSHPDGLEWSIFKTAGTEEVESSDSRIYSVLANLQEKFAFLPDYGFKASKLEPENAAASEVEEETEAWPAIDSGTTVSGIVGGLLVLLIMMAVGFALKLTKNTSTVALKN